MSQLACERSLSAAFKRIKRFDPRTSRGVQHLIQLHLESTHRVQTFANSIDIRRSTIQIMSSTFIRISFTSYLLAKMAAYPSMMES